MVYFIFFCLLSPEGAAIKILDKNFPRNSKMVVLFGARHFVVCSNYLVLFLVKKYWLPKLNITRCCSAATLYLNKQNNVKLFLDVELLMLCSLCS